MRLLSAVRAVLPVFLALATSAQAQDPRSAQLTAYLSARAGLGHLNGSVVVADSGRMLIDTAFGYANFELGVPNSRETRFRVASLTKQFTAMAVMMLQENGHLNVRDSIGRYLESLPQAWNGITIHHLLRHTSGVSDYEEWFHGYTTQAYSDYMARADAAPRIVEDAKERPLDFEPGAEFHYSNTGYILLGYIIERASGMSYAEFLRSRVLEPLGMRLSGMDHADSILPGRAAGYALKPGAFPGPYYNGLTVDDIRIAHYQLMAPPQGDAGLITTAEDLYRWDEALYTERLVSQVSLDSMFAPGDGGYGYGWNIREGAYGVTHRHSGGLPGFACFILRFPDRRGTIIVLGNLQSLSGQIIRDITSIVMGEPYVMPAPRRIVDYDATVHGRFNGMYHAEDGDSLEVFFDDVLLVRWEGHFTAGMFPESDRDFFLALTQGVARFREREGGLELVILDANGEPQIAAVRE